MQAQVAVPDCPSGFVTTTTGLPGIAPSLSLLGDGTVNYTCINFQPLTYAWTFAWLNDAKNLYEGQVYYDQNEQPIIALQYQHGPERKLVLAKEVFQMPSPTPDTLEWSRWKVLSDSGSAIHTPFTYVERRDTVHGHT